MPVPIPEEDDLETAIATVARQLAQEARSTVSEHPSTEELVAYQEQRLAEPDRDRIRRHLVVCAECAHQLLALEDFDLEIPEGSELLPSAAETAASWASFQQRLAREREPPSHSRPRHRPATGPRPRLSRFNALPPAALLAASLVLFVGSLGLWLHGTQRPAGPGGASPYVFELFPDGEDLRREATTTVEITVPAGMDLLVPRLLLGNQDAYATYRAELLDAAGRTVARREGLQRQPEGSFALTFARAELPAGDYRLEVSGLSDGQPRRLATYSFRLRYATET